MAIPISVNKLKVKDFIKFQQLKEQSFEFNIYRDIAMLCLLTGKSEDYFNNLGGKERSVYINRLIPILKSFPTSKKNHVIWLNGKRYKAAMSEKDFSFNAWAALKDYELDQNTNIEKILALIYTPTPLFGKRVFNSDIIEEVANDILNHATIKQVYGMFFFYFNRSESLKAILKVSLLESQLVIMDHLKEIQQDPEAINLNMDGITSLTN